jgi:rubrerythrin
MHTTSSPLEAVYLTETTQAARLELFALRADNEARPRLAIMLRAVARAKKVHAAKALMQLRGKIGSTEENLTEAQAMLEALPATMREWMEAAEGPQEALISQCMKTAMNHASLTKRLNEDSEMPYHVCTVCGFIAMGDMPERCPVCRALPSKFETLE